MSAQALRPFDGMGGTLLVSHLGTAGFALLLVVIGTLSLLAAAPELVFHFRRKRR
jgi:hypothetical protein